MLLSVGLDFRRARLEVRERFHLDDDDVFRLYETLSERGAHEAVVTRTCNRLEATCWWPDGPDAEHRALEIARAWVREDEAEARALLSSARLRGTQEVPRHLFRVAAGLESQVLGDIHIVGQLRRAFRDAVEARTVGSHLHRLFETALRVGRQVKRETGLMATRSGVGSEAARRAARHGDGLAGRRCLVVGAGKIGAQAAVSLAELGATEIVVVNRSLPRAARLARELGAARPAGLDELPALLASAQVVIVATGAPEPVLSAADLARARGADAPPLLVVDVSVPRNVESRVGLLHGVELVDLDTLHPEAAEVEKTRVAAIPDAEALVDDAVGEFLVWLELNAARRALTPMRTLLAEICRREVAHLAGESPLAERTAERIVAAVMAQPMTALRAATERGETVEHATGALLRLFGEARTA